MTSKMFHLIKKSNYLVDYEAHDYTVLDSTKTPEKIYEQLCEDYELYQPYALDVEDFEDWVNREYTAMEILQYKNLDLNFDLSEAEKVYRRTILDPAIEEFFTDSEYFVWL